MSIAAPSRSQTLDYARKLPVQAKAERLGSLDAYRGLAMLLMASEILNLPRVAKNFPNNPTWQKVGHWLDHVPWRGGVVWDMIQPSFMFMVGVALAFSIASRQAKGESFTRMLLHAIWRSALLVMLGVFHDSYTAKQTLFSFNNVLCQIGLGYTFLFLFAWLRPQWQAVAAGALLLGDWIAFAVYPAPGAGFDFTKFGVPADWPHHLHGFAAHWDKNTNVAAAFDRWFLNLFPREERWPSKGNGGYHTLNFIPSLATMTFGLLVGGLLRSSWPVAKKLLTLLLAGIVGVGLGWVLDRLGICPIVKRIWTPAWALYAGGWTCMTLALFYLVIDVAKLRAWTLPLVVVGMNSIAMYMMVELFNPFFREALHTHFGRLAFFDRTNPYITAREGGIVLVLLWLICFWMYRRKLFLKI